MLTIDKYSDNYVVSLKGTKRLNVLIAEIVKKKLLKLLNKSGKTLVFDLSGIYFIDTEGFGILLETLYVAKKNACIFKLANVSNEVNELINLLELSDKFEICQDFNDKFYGLNAA